VKSPCPALSKIRSALAAVSTVAAVTQHAGWSVGDVWIVGGVAGWQVSLWGVGQRTAHVASR
jgi:hypothetical protein